MNRPTTEDDVIVISPGQLSACLDLRRTSSLIGCISVDSDTTGRVIFKRKWPQLSSGEERLWLVLAWLNGQASYPDMADLEAHLDADNYRAAVAAVNS